MNLLCHLNVNLINTINSKKTKNKSYISFQFKWLYLKIQLSTVFYIMARLVSFRLSVYFNVTVFSVAQCNCWIIGHVSLTSEDVYSSVSKGFVSRSSRIWSSCDVRTAESGAARLYLLKTMNRGVIFWTVNWNVRCTTCEQFLNHICWQLRPGILDYNREKYPRLV